jgi:hypothetical protein
MFVTQKQNRPKHHWGTFLWGFIHTITIVDSQNNYQTNSHLLEKLKPIYHVIPCDKCQGKYQEYITKLNYLDLRESMVLFYWSVDLHNAVNVKLGKPTWSYQQAREHWCTTVM